MATSIVLIKSFPYRDLPEEWSNKYFLTGADPASPAEWTTLFDALVAEEKKLYSSVCKVVRGYGYTDDSPSAASVWSRDLTAAEAEVLGTFTVAGSQQPGDAAATVRWKTSRLSSSGKPIYLRKYFHCVFGKTGDADEITATQIVAYEAFATLLWDGAGVDSRFIRGPGQSSEDIVGSSCSKYITTRTLKRRGRRPTTA